MQAHFIEIDSSSIKIGLGGKRDETTRNIAVQKRKEVEEVCSKVLQRPIKVMFKFVATDALANQAHVKAPLPLSPAIAPPPIAHSNPISQTVSSPSPVAPSSSERLVNADNPVADNPIQMPPTQTKGYVGMSEEDMVVRNMAEFFNGQIVDLDEPSI